MCKCVVVEIIAIEGIPIVGPGDDLVALITAGLAVGGGSLVEGDVVVVTSKVVSKAEGRLVMLTTDVVDRSVVHQ